MFNKYDDIVIGSGISGLTIALVLAQNDRKVLLLEKAPYLGGSLKRFYREGIPFDVGLHFSGGLGTGEIFTSMLSVLGIENDIQTYFFDKTGDNTIIFEDKKSSIVIPSGIDNFRRKLKSLFYDESAAIDSYFDFVQKIYNETVLLNLKDIDKLTVKFDEDYTSLSEILNQLTKNELLKAVLEAYWPCYGTRPSEISYANHCRIVAAFYEKIARIVGGGDALIEAYRKKLLELNVDIKLNTYLNTFDEVSKKYATGCTLNTGENIVAKNYIFTIHPNEIIKFLPHKRLSKGFLSRVEDFEPSTGFFSLYCIADKSVSRSIVFYPSVITLYPDCNVDNVSNGINSDNTAIIIFIDKDKDRTGKNITVFNILETSNVSDVSQWNESSSECRNEGYCDYKKNRTKLIIERIYRQIPELCGKLKILDSASLLTYKDYLNSYDGSAYGIKQKVGQFNLFARLPVRNIYAVGQNSVLPGVLGAMISSFMLGRLLLGEKKYNCYIEREGV